MHFLIQTKSWSSAWNRLSTVSKLNQVISQRVLRAELTKSESLSGILNWSLEGLDRLLKNRVFSDERSESTMAIDYEKKSNPVKYFVHEHIDTVFEGLDNTKDNAAFAVSRVTEAEVLQAYVWYAKKHTLPSINKAKIMATVKYECERAGIFVNTCRDRYMVGSDGKPKIRQNYLKGIKICGLEYLKTENENVPETENSETIDNLEESMLDKNITAYKCELSETTSVL